MGAAERFIEDLVDMLADRVAAKLAANQAPKVYTQDQPPPGMSKRTYLDHCYRGSWPSRKVGRLRVTDAAEFDAWRNTRPLRAARAKHEPVEDIVDEVAYVTSGGKKGKR